MKVSPADDGILNAVEHIEGELQRLGRLVATLKRRIEASQSASNEDAAAASTPAVVASTPISSVIITGSASRASARSASQSQRRFPIAIDEPDLDDEAVVRTATGGTSYGFVRERPPEQTSSSWKKKTLESEPAHVVGGDELRHRKTR